MKGARRGEGRGVGEGRKGREGQKDAVGMEGGLGWDNRKGEVGGEGCSSSSTCACLTPAPQSSQHLPHNVRPWPSVQHHTPAQSRSHIDAKIQN